MNNDSDACPRCGLPMDIRGGRYACYRCGYPEVDDETPTPRCPICRAYLFDGRCGWCTNPPSQANTNTNKRRK